MNSRLIKPNIIYLHSHDTGRYIQPYGHAIPTPNLQRLAEQGVLFRQAFDCGPTCSPARAALVTGQYPHSCGMLGLAHRGFSLKNYGDHIIHTLKDAGYVTALAGVQHVASHEKGEPWKTIGYDQYLGHAGQAHEKAAEFLANPPEQPFFLAVGFVETHREFPEEHPEDDPRYCLPPAPLPDTPQTRKDMARFKASARMLDKKMGAVIDAVDRNGLADKTLIICTTDHGIAFPRMKCNLTDSGIGVMLIMRGPGGFEGGGVIDSLVSHVDIFPTVCDLAGIAAPDRLQGVSFMPLVRGEQQDVREEIHSEVTFHAAYEPKRCVRTKRYKYIKRFDDRISPVLPNCDDGLSKTVWMDQGWTDQPPPGEALYDVIFDPNESQNLVGHAAYEEALADMRARLDHWMKETDDPVLKGLPVPAPEGARVNDVDGISPREPMQGGHS